VAVLLVVVAASPTESADPDGWAVDLTGDRAGVSLGTSRSVWWSGRAQLIVGTVDFFRGQKGWNKFERNTREAPPAPAAS